jgi:hypothetical protein
VKHKGSDIVRNVVLSGFFFYLYNELAFMFLSEVGPVTSSVMNTAKVHRVNRVPTVCSVSLCLYPVHMGVDWYGYRYACLCVCVKRDLLGVKRDLISGMDTAACLCVRVRVHHVQVHVGPKGT